MLKDPIENTKDYILAMEQIDPILDNEFPPDQYMMGTCYKYWARKKELLRKKGIEWKTPAEMNPNIRFD